MKRWRMKITSPRAESLNGSGRKEFMNLRPIRDGLEASLMADVVIRAATNDDFTNRLICLLFLLIIGRPKII